jgi:hypothetical protein
MRTKPMLSLLLLAAVVITFASNDAQARLPAPPGLPPLPGMSGGPDVNVHVNGFLPAPPGVHVQIDSGRPYYVEREQRIYIERERPVKHHKKKKHHNNRGHGYGHDQHERRGH